MKLGVFTVLFGAKPFEEMLDYVVDLGLEAVESGTGAYPGDAYCKPEELLGSEKKLKAFRQAIRKRGLTISALSCHGNPLHPQSARALADHQTFVQTLQLAKKLEVETVITFSGCPARNCSAFMRRPPSNCNSSMRTAQSPHATTIPVLPASRISPGFGSSTRICSTAARQIFISRACPSPA